MGRGVLDTWVMCRAGLGKWMDTYIGLGGGVGGVGKEEGVGPRFVRTMKTWTREGCVDRCLCQNLNSLLELSNNLIGRSVRTEDWYSVRFIFFLRLALDQKILLD